MFFLVRLDSMDIPYLVPNVARSGLGPETVCKLLYSENRFMNNVVAFKPDEAYVLMNGRYTEVNAEKLYDWVYADETLRQYLYIAPAGDVSRTQDFRLTGKWDKVFAKLAETDTRSIQERFDCVLKNIKCDVLSLVLNESNELVNPKYEDTLRKELFYKPFGWTEDDDYEDEDENPAVQKGKCLMQMMGLALQDRLAQGKCAGFIVGEADTGKSTMFAVANLLLGDGRIVYKRMSELTPRLDRGTGQFELLSDVMAGCKLFYLEEGVKMGIIVLKELVGGSTSKMSLHVPNKTKLKGTIKFPGSFMFTQNEADFLNLFKGLTPNEYKRVIVLKTQAKPFEPVDETDASHPFMVFAGTDELKKGYRLALASILKDAADDVDNSANYAAEAINKFKAVKADREWWLAEKGLSTVSKGVLKPSDITEEVLSRFNLTWNAHDGVEESDYRRVLREFYGKSLPDSMGKINRRLLDVMDSVRPQHVLQLEPIREKQAWHDWSVDAVPKKGIRHMTMLQGAPATPSASRGVPATPSASQYAPHTPSASLASPPTPSVEVVQAVIAENASLKKQLELVHQRLDAMSQQMSQQTQPFADDATSASVEKRKRDVYEAEMAELRALVETVQKENAELRESISSNKKAKGEGEHWLAGPRQALREGAAADMERINAEAAALVQAAKAKPSEGSGEA